MPFKIRNDELRLKLAQLISAFLDFCVALGSRALRSHPHRYDSMMDETLRKGNGAKSVSPLRFDQKNYYFSQSVVQFG